MLSRGCEEHPSSDHQGNQVMPRFAAGRVFEIPLNEDGAAYGLMLARFPYFAFYLADSIDKAMRVQRPPADDPLFTVSVYRSTYSMGRWGGPLHQVRDEELPGIPSFFRQNVMNPDDCEIVDATGNTRAATPDECTGLERSAVWSGENIEERLGDRRAGRPNEHVRSMMLKI